MSLYLSVAEVHLSVCLALCSWSKCVYTICKNSIENLHTFKYSLALSLPPCIPHTITSQWHSLDVQIILWKLPDKMFSKEHSQSLWLEPQYIKFIFVCTANAWFLENIVVDYKEEESCQQVPFTCHRCAAITTKLPPSLWQPHHPACLSQLLDHTILFI